MMKIVITLSILISVAACSTAEVVEDNSRAHQTLEELYQRGKAERISGAPDECLKTFNKLIDLRKAVKDSLFAYSLYQSGLCHEMKLDYDRAIAVYQDALRIKAIVNSELADLEIPSRLAISYERVGESQIAKNYYTKVKNYIEKLKKNKKDLLEKKEYYAETLFQMGTIANNYMPGKIAGISDEKQDFTNYLNSISYSQEYLMMVLELDVKPYAEYALSQMVKNFESSYEFVKQLPLEPLEDEVVAQRLRQVKQKDMSTILAYHIDRFEIESSVQKKSKRKDYQEIFNKLTFIKKSLDDFINERPIGEGLTPEAQKLQDPKIEGKFVPVEGEAE